MVKYGIVAKEPIAKAALGEINIEFKEGKEMKELLSRFLDIMYSQEPASIGGELPDNDFYYDKSTDNDTENGSVMVSITMIMFGLLFLVF